MVLLPACMAGSIRVHCHTNQRHSLPRRSDTVLKRTSANILEQLTIHHANNVHRKRALHDIEQRRPDEQSLRRFTDWLCGPSLEPYVSNQAQPPLFHFFYSSFPPPERQVCITRKKSQLARIFFATLFCRAHFSACFSLLA